MSLLVDRHAFALAQCIGPTDIAESRSSDPQDRRACSQLEPAVSNAMARWSAIIGVLVSAALRRADSPAAECAYHKLITTTHSVQAQSNCVATASKTGNVSLLMPCLTRERGKLAANAERAEAHVPCSPRADATALDSSAAACVATF